MLAGRVRPGDVVVIVGAGPIGLAAVMTAKLFSPSRIVVVDLLPRRDAAERIGADAVNDSDAAVVVELVSSLTDGLEPMS